MGKKTIIKHRLVTRTNGSLYTSCGRYIPRYTSTTIRTNKTWKGVTCQKCLAVKAKAERTATAKKSVKSYKVGATV